MAGENNFKALIFDCDGTLVDSMPLHMKAWKEAFNHFNTYYNEVYLYSLKGMKETEIIELYNSRFETNLEPGEIVKVKHDYFLEHISSVSPIQKVVDIARSYYGKLPLGVVSGSIQDIVFKELEVIGIKSIFDVILTANDPFKPKPAPDIFIAAAGALNVLPEECVVYEDGDPGIEAAKAAGMKTVDVRINLL